MRLHEQLRSMDVERVIMVPAMIFSLCLALFALFSGVNLGSSSALVDSLYVVYLALLTGFYLMAVVFLLIRSPAKARSEGLVPRIAAYLGTFLPLLFAFVEGSQVADGVAVFAVGLMTLGMAFSLYSLISLGRSFGVEAKVRNLVQRGPYRFIRNPLYVGEMITLAGAVCFSPSLPKVMILLACGGIQVYRAIHEERLLEQHIPEYAAYKLQTKRFVPGLF